MQVKWIDDNIFFSYAEGVFRIGGKLVQAMPESISRFPMLLQKSSVKISDFLFVTSESTQNNGFY